MSKAGERSADEPAATPEREQALALESLGRDGIFHLGWIRLYKILRYIIDLFHFVVLKFWNVVCVQDAQQDAEDEGSQSEDCWNPS